jgi:hypothetical protein
MSEPWFGRLLPPTWRESSVVFSRSERRDDGRGGYTEGEPAELLATTAHVSVGGGTFPDDQGGAVRRRVLRVYFPWPEEPGQALPRQGDWVSWTSDAGRAYRLRVQSVESPLNAGQYLVAETEAFD